MGQYDLTLGTFMIGIIFNTYLYGLVTFQFAKYYRAKFNDPPVIKYMILFLFLLDTFHSMAVVYMLWAYAVTNYTNPDILAIGLWPHMFTPIATALAAIMTQLFLGYRIYRLSKSKIIYGIIIAIAFPGCVLGILTGIRAIIIEVLADLPVLDNIIIGWLTLQVACDLTITCVLTWLLLHSRTGFRRTDTVLYRLIRGAVQTGLFAGIFSVADLATFLTLPETNLYGMFAIPIGRIYTNTLLDTLLARDELREMLSGSVEMDTTRDTRGGRSTVQWAKRPQPQGVALTEISVQQDVVTFHDGSQEQSDAASYKKAGSMTV
ncbi:hypothetical protein QCA50_006720 [Cerrena zonata]|uniref:DUF6534 domain-containing protein n=1 Tax=Cerrena zonata TaxID=2478898 RepID=A0AAW0GE66_9APHY